MDHQGIPSHFLTEENILKNIYFWGMWKGRDRVTPGILRRLIIIRTWLSLAQSFFSLSSLLVEHDLVQIYGGKTLPKMQEIWVWSLDWKDPLEKRMATHSSIPAWKIPWTEEPDGLQSMRLRSVEHGLSDEHLQNIINEVQPCLLNYDRLLMVSWMNKGRKNEWMRH